MVSLVDVYLLGSLVGFYFVPLTLVYLLGLIVETTNFEFGGNRFVVFDQLVVVE